jgi:hypothetical protein
MMILERLAIACALLAVACAETGPDPQGFNGAGGGSEKSGFGTVDNGGEQGGFGRAGAGGPRRGVQSSSGDGMACFDLCQLALTCASEGTVDVEFRFEPAVDIQLDDVLNQCARWCDCAVGRVPGLAAYVGTLARDAFCDEGLAVTSATAGQLEAMEDQFDGDTIAAAMNICAQEVGFGLWNLFDYDQEAQGRVHVEFLP